MGTIYAGTSGWAYAQWKPDFYPAKLASAKFLGYYATRLNSVELNFTFRRFATEKQQMAWIEATPENFRFSVKANQNITHVKRLKDAGQLASDFLDSLRPLQDANRLGPVLFQLPPFLKLDLPRLEDFLAGLPRAPRSAFEFRHDSWFCDPVYAALRKANSALCEAESAKLETPEMQTADYSYLRLRKEDYSPKDRRKLAAKVADRAVRGDVFVYFKHEDTPEGALYAESLLTSA